jgi:hypothetical protein
MYHFTALSNCYIGLELVFFGILQNGTVWNQNGFKIWSLAHHFYTIMFQIMFWQNLVQISVLLNEQKWMKWRFFMLKRPCYCASQLFLHSWILPLPDINPGSTDVHGNYRNLCWTHLSLSTKEPLLYSPTCEYVLHYLSLNLRNS